MTFRDLRNFAVALLVGVLAVALCRADSCVRVHRTVVSSYTPSYATYTPVVSAVSYQQVVAVPVYSGYYDSNLALLLQTLVQSQQAQAARLDSQEQFLRQQPGPTVSTPRTPAPMPQADPTQPAAPGTPQAGLGLPKLFARSCVQCHSDAATKGGGVSLFTNGQWTATCDVHADVIDDVTAEKMPKSGEKATPEEVDEMMAFLRKQAHARAGK